MIQKFSKKNHIKNRSLSFIALWSLSIEFNKKKKNHWCIVKNVCYKI
jgi:hypothetical protein